jgi:hypothetical protein
MRLSEVEFVRQQGFAAAVADHRLYAALMFQPRVVGSALALGALLQSPWPFLVLFLALGWSALVPTRSLFDAAYNRLIARPRGFPPLGPAPAPRRFAAGMAAMLTLAIYGALLLGARTTAWVLEGLAAAGVLSVVFARFCEGAAVYHLLVRAVARARGPAGVGAAPTR